MNAPVLILVSLALSGSALIFGALAAIRSIRQTSITSSAWAASSLGVLGLAAAVAGGSVWVPDLATVAGVVLVGGVAGAGWAPPGRRLLLFLAPILLAAGLLARLEASSNVLVVEGLSWGVARSSGFVAFLAATGAVVLGARRPAGLPIGGLPARVYALHRALGIAAVLALAVHLAALWTDDFVEFTWGQLLFVPWTSTYEPLAVTLGWLAMLALLLTAASGGLRRLLPGGAWRAVHALAYLTFALGLSHGLLAGSDSGSPAALAFYLATLLAVGWTLLRRKFPRSRPPTRRGWKEGTGGNPAPVPDAARGRSARVLLRVLPKLLRRAFL